MIALAAVAAYSRTFSAPCVLDDLPTIVGNATIRRWGTAFTAHVADSTATARPVFNLTLALNYALGRTAVAGYHVLNLLIHVTAGLALFGVVRRTLLLSSVSAALPLAFFSALIWTVHPLQTESVTYLSQRAESLMGCFYLLTLYGFIRGATAGPGAGGPCWFAFSVGACLAGMGTKEVMVSAPVIVLLYDRIFIADEVRTAARRRGWVHLLLGATWLFLGYLVLTTGANRGATATGLGAGVRWWDYALTQFPAITRYLALAFWPSPLVFEYGTFWTHGLRAVLPQAAAVAALAVGTLGALLRWPRIGFLGVVFFAILAPTSLVAGTVQMIAEHRMYLALAPVVVLAVLALHRLLGRGAFPLCGLVAVVLLGVTWNRNLAYRTAESLWADTVAKRPANARAHTSLGAIYLEAPGRLAEAQAQFEAALRAKPDDELAHMDLGVAFSRMPGRRADAMAQYREALRVDPQNAACHADLAEALAADPAGIREAVQEFERALQLDPGFFAAHVALGNLWYRTGQFEAAAGQYEAALSENDGDPDIHFDLGNTWLRLPGRRDAAVAEYREALRLRPDFAAVHSNLGAVLLEDAGKLEDATAELEEALRLNPDAPGAHFSLAVAFLKADRRDDAIAQLEAGLRLDPGDAAARGILDRLRATGQ